MVAGYEVVAPLGRGATGLVELATAPDGRQVALKRVALAGSADELAAARARLRREAEVLAHLDHPGIVRLLDVVDDGPDLVLVMPWYRGGSLADRVTAHGPLDPGDVDRLADHLLGALAAAHRAGVVHRDVKPANVLFDEAGRPHLADFGVASARGVTAGLTVGGVPLGTPGFLAPEQARGEPAGPAADVFGLGATLRFAATGRGPYGGGPAEVLLWRAARGKVDRCPRSLPPRLRRRVDAMLAPRPERRPTAAALASGPAGTVAVAPPPGPGAPERRGPLAPFGRARRAAAGTGAVVAVAACVAYLVAILVALGSDGPDPAGGSPDVAVPTTEPVCLPGHADYDGDPGNGCEAVPDDLDGRELLDELRPNLVPAEDVDEFPVPVDDTFQLLCDGRLTLRVTAPAGATVRLEVLDADGSVRGEVTSADGVPGEVTLAEPNCFRDDSTTLLARITSVGSDRTAEPYLLEREGGW